MSGEDVPSVEQVTGTGIPVRGNDIDTDQIIPARFMKVVTFDGLGQFAFFDKRFDSAAPEGQRNGDDATVDDDNQKDHPFNEERFQGANVLVVNANFGCGSSREHAPQALMRWGIDAVIGESFAEIFAGNCLALGIPTITAEEEGIELLQTHVEENPDAELFVDVPGERVESGEEISISVTVDEAQRTALVDGIWDTTALMRANETEIEATAEEIPYI